jgi:hypothetical protein
VPRAGYWSGEDVHFRVSADGRISELWIRGDALPTSCVYDWKDEQKALSGGRFTYSYRDNEVKGFYGNDKKFHGTYELLLCDNIYIYAGQPPLRGKWEASWASSQ